jgi:hypothetical protein
MQQGHYNGPYDHGAQNCAKDAKGGAGTLLALLCALCGAVHAATGAAHISRRN